MVRRRLNSTQLNSTLAGTRRSALMFSERGRATKTPYSNRCRHEYRSRGQAMRAVAKSLLVLALLAAVPAFAQSPPPARVGRVSLVSGTLAFYGPGDTEWSAAKV